jgi:hypothetical protein
METLKQALIERRTLLERLNSGEWKPAHPQYQRRRLKRQIKEILRKMEEQIENPTPGGDYLDDGKKIPTRRLLNWCQVIEVGKIVQISGYDFEVMQVGDRGRIVLGPAKKQPGR